ncbi:MAG: nucleoside 2-deoxyribosyltransferase [Anaerolineae bacterium]|nr:nucleoside 2-deoxyribosyltransferase [Anaerolineae bacterium]
MPKAYLAIKYHADHANCSRIEGIIKALETSGFYTVCITRDLEQWGRVQFAADELMARSLAAIDTCDVIVVDLTEKGVGIGIEAGYAYAREIPIITIAQTGSDISATLRGISTWLKTYKHYSDLIDCFQNKVDIFH